MDVRVIQKSLPCRYSILTVWAFDHIENKYNLYRGKDCIKKLCESIREHAKNTVDFEKKNFTINKKTKITSRCKSMLHLRKKHQKKIAESENYRKVRDHCDHLS